MRRSFRSDESAASTDQQCRRWMGAGVVARKDDRDIRLGLRPVVEREGAVGPDVRSSPESEDQSRHQPGRGIGVRCALRTHPDECSAQEFDTLVLEKSEIDEPIVFGARERADLLGCQ